MIKRLHIEAVLLGILLIPIWATTFFDQGNLKGITVFAGLMISYFAGYFFANLTVNRYKQLYFPRFELFVAPVIYLILAIILEKNKVLDVSLPIAFAFLLSGYFIHRRTRLWLAVPFILAAFFYVHCIVVPKLLM